MIDIYKASAGSGKTFTLAREYIKMMLGRQTETGDFVLDRKRRERHRKILAITFTNKATAEMKTRILAELAVLGNAHPDRPGAVSPYAADLCAALHCSPEELQTEARRALCELMFDYDMFNVSTIDSFFQQILRTFAREAELTGDYDLNLDSEGPVAMAVDDMFTSIGAAPRFPISRQDSLKLEAWLTQWLKDTLRNGKSTALFNRTGDTFGALTTFFKNLLGEEFIAHEKELRHYFGDFENVAALRPALIRWVEESLAGVRTLSARALELCQTRSGINSRFADQLKKYADCTADEVKSAPTKTVTGVCDDVSAAFLKSARDVNSADAGLCDALQAAARAIVALHPQIGAAKLIAQDLPSLGLFGHILHNLEQARQDSNTLLLSDTASLLRDLLKDPADTPFVFERLGTLLSHFLIDEFQDTSLVQWDNLRPLVADTLSRGRDSLIIGDEKQCIYRFRYSDPSLLRHGVADDFAGMTRTRGGEPGENTNWRSLRNVVEFNNTLFEQLAQMSGTGEVYANVRQMIAPKHQDASTPGGYVSLMLVDAQAESFAAFDGTPLPDSDPDFTPSKAQTEAMRCGSAREFALARMADAIRRQLQSGYRAKDITVLTRARNEGAMVIQYLLDRQHRDPEYPRFRIVSADALRLGSCPSVLQVVAVIRRMAGLVRVSDPEEGDTTPPRKPTAADKTDRLVSLYRTMVSVGTKADEALAKAIAQVAEGSADTDMDADLLQAASDLVCPNLYTMSERLIDYYLSAEARKRDNIYLSAFMDALNDYCNAPGADGADIPGFIKWWDATGVKTCIDLPEADDTMSVMTIHKAKGLEYPCVHIPFAEECLAVQHKGIKWFDMSPMAEIMPDYVTAVMPPLMPMKPSKTSMDGTPLEPQCTKYYAEDVEDSMNVSYVAMTRAGRELTVTALYNKVTKKDMQLLNDLQTIAPELGKCTETDHTLHVAVGEPVAPQQRHDAVRQTEVLPPYTSNTSENTWTGATIELPDGATHIDTDGRKTGRQAGLMEEGVHDEQRAKRRGIVLHAALSAIRTAADLPRAVRRLVRRRSLHPADAAAVTAMLRNAVESPGPDRWFAPGVKVLNERGIRLPTTANADARLRRPDRVVMMPDGSVEIVDYKFGNPSPDSLNSYRRQVRAYARIYRDLGYKNVTGTVWLVDSGRLVAATD